MSAPRTLFGLPPDPGLFAVIEPGAEPKPKPKPRPRSVSAWAIQSLGFHPDPSQTRILDCPDARVLICTTRQYGKSTLTSIHALHLALFSPNTLTVVAAPNLRRSAEWIRLARNFARRLGLRPRSDGVHPHSLLLPNDSRLVALPGVIANNRGYPAHLLIFEEAAIVPDEMFHVLTPSLAATNGRLWLISSAGPSSGFFYDQWQEQRVPWTRFKVPATDCPRISPEFLAQERILKGERAFNREYLCHFDPAGRKLISRDLLLAAIDPSFQPWSQGKLS